VSPPCAPAAPAASEIRRLTPDDALYPKSLLVVANPPRALYALGDCSLLGRPLVAIVGSRTPTPYGSRVAYAAAQVAARAGLVVVSGMARGLDTRAHRGALDAGGATIAVLGSGVDVPYPRSNCDLYRDVRSRGLVLSEQEPGSRPHEGSFPLRNRIIAGLAQCLLVVEGRITGGTTSTTKMVSDLHKTILAVPGRIDDDVAAGPNYWITQGARMYRGPEDLLEEFGLHWQGVVDGERRADALQLEALLGDDRDLLAAEAQVFDALRAEPAHVDAIAAMTRLDAGTLLAALSSLELKGLAVQLPGKQFRLAA
jgi:DNA processing protein